MIEWISLSQGGKVNGVDPATNTLITDFGNHTAQVANVIPPQRAGRIAAIAGAADNTGWCAIDPVTFESKSAPNIHVIGDACIAGTMPKSAFSANSQAKICASAIATLLAGGTPAAPKLINTCYSLAAPGYGISVAGVYTPKNGVWADVEGAGGVSPADAPADFRAREADFAQPGSRRSRRKSLASRTHRMSGPILAGALLTLPGFAAAQELRGYAVVGDAIPKSLTNARGDAARGRALVVERSSTCILCHSGPFPEQKFQGDLAPDLSGSGKRWSEGQLRFRLVDASRLNAETIMPSYYRIEGLNRVGPAWRGKPILSAEQIEDVLAYLVTLRE